MEKEIKSGIYKITNIENGKLYIGSAVNIKKRFSVHKSLLNNNKHHSRYLQHSWNKHTFEKFIFEVLEYVKDLKMLIDREQHWLDELESYNIENGYNMCEIAGSVFGLTHTNETKLKMRNTKLGKPTWNKGKTNIYSEETIKKMSDSKIGSKWMIGKKPSNETKLKMRNSKLGKSASEGTKLKMSVTRMGKSKSGRKLINSKGDIFLSIKEASKSYSYSIGYLYKMIQEFKPNKTDLSYLT